MGSWVKVRPWSVGLGYEEKLHLIRGPLAGLSWNGTPAKWVHEMTHICPTTLPKPCIPNLVA